MFNSDLNRILKNEHLCLHLFYVFYNVKLQSFSQGKILIITLEITIIFQLPQIPSFLPTIQEVLVP